MFLNIFIAIILDSFADQASAFSLPVTQNSIDDFVVLWANYDPHATGFLPAKHLEQFVIDVAESDGANLLLLSPKLLIPEFSDKDDDLLDVHAERRRRYLAQLEIPMYENYGSVHFYDVLQQMTLQVVMLAYNRELIAKNKKLMKAISIMKTGKPGHGDDTLGAIAAEHLQADYDVDFHDFAQNMTKLDKKIELMQ